MQTTASIHRVTASADQAHDRGTAHVRSHRRARGPLQLPWQFNLAAIILIGLGIAVCILLQM